MLRRMGKGRTSRVKTKDTMHRDEEEAKRKTRNLLKCEEKKKESKKKENDRSEYRSGEKKRLDYLVHCYLHDDSVYLHVRSRGALCCLVLNIAIASQQGQEHGCCPSSSLS